MLVGYEWTIELYINVPQHKVNNGTNRVEWLVCNIYNKKLMSSKFFNNPQTPKPIKGDKKVKTTQVRKTGRGK